MKYLAICFLSLTAYLNAGAATPAGTEVRAVVRAVVEDDRTRDGAIAGALAAALIALQLRRRQKSMRMPRQFN